MSSEAKPLGWLGTTSCTVVGYVVEVRATVDAVERFGIIVTREWTPLQTKMRPYGEGVPNNIRDPLAAFMGMMSFDSASAVMALAAADSHHGVEFRLVKQEMKYTEERRELGVGPAHSFDYLESRDLEFVNREPRSEPARG